MGEAKRKLLERDEQMKRLGLAIANWFLLITAPIWVGFLMWYLFAIAGSRVKKEMLTGRRRFMDGI